MGTNAPERNMMGISIKIEKRTVSESLLDIVEIIGIYINI